MGARREAREALAAAGLRPRKRWGQHFLCDPAVARRIVETAELGPRSVALEIGPGLGALTGELSARAGRLYLVEVDPALANRLAARFAGEPRVRTEGFTEVMAEWMAAADVLVHSTGGLTVLESIMRGSRPISYGWGRGHIRLNNEGYRRFDLADVVASRSELGRAIRAALARERMPLNGFAELPSAASFVLAAARG